MSAIARQIMIDAARAALAARDLRRAAELYAAIALDDEIRAADPVGGGH